MILDKIRVKNFGVYGGEHEALLTPEKGRPIILFGAMNGGGKTTLLDGIQLALYGSKASLSNRDRLSYKDYLLESIHHSDSERKEASVALEFRKVLDGKSRSFEVRREWSAVPSGVEERLSVFTDGEEDQVLTEHWSEVAQGYLPSSIAHLFFFDGEQIKELADKAKATAILNDAIHALLGLDHIDRLTGDLKTLERRKKSETLDSETTGFIDQVKGEIAAVEQEQANVASQSGSLKNDKGRIEKELKEALAQFKLEGGETYLARERHQAESLDAKKRFAAASQRLRDLAAGPLPLALVSGELSQLERVIKKDARVSKAKMLQETLEERDDILLKLIAKQGIAAKRIEDLREQMTSDREERCKDAGGKIVIGARLEFAINIQNLREGTVPALISDAKDLIRKIRAIDAEVVELDRKLALVPPEERVLEIQKRVADLEIKKAEKEKELLVLDVRKQVLASQREQAESKLSKLLDDNFEREVVADDRERVLRHSEKVRRTLERFRVEIVKRHIKQIEELVLESFTRLLRKKSLVSRIEIDPETFEPKLFSQSGVELSFDRLSAGERQLLATAMLWGLARASNRPLPTIIDTPLSRLDSSHRRNLVEEYFPKVAHQVLLLSTDEEIVGKYFGSLKPYITRSFVISHDQASRSSSIKAGYFEEK